MNFLKTDFKKNGISRNFIKNYNIQLFFAQRYFFYYFFLF